ncbi:Retrovirus-related Pol polyprotein from transposon RE2 [Vitis vinifera]|uniref:Retrovirus-related Pol polyprotein from transposon RE2 n=1 Tax=Vitis vinifera TaxID=29760 RepID=A0A438JPL0_VITVI|nr:Retrovirus-related Pol polyprotein from transposon RE2 [Vitis vinifera]
MPKNHPISNAIGNVNEHVVTRRQSRLNEMGIVCYTSQLEPKNVKEASGDESWTTALQEELNQFIRNDVWYLVPRPKDKHVIARLESIRILLAMAYSLRIKLYQMDVKSTFLKGILSEEAYVEQPKGFEDPRFPNHVYRLKKALYGLKQVPRVWYERLTTYLLEKKFKTKEVDKGLFIHRSKDELLVA